MRFAAGIWSCRSCPRPTATRGSSPIPDRLDIRRDPQRNLAFGYGIHFCLGAWLARLEAQLSFDAVLERLPNLALAPVEPRWRPTIFLRGLQSLPIRWNTAQRSERRA